MGFKAIFEPQGYLFQFRGVTSCLQQRPYIPHSASHSPATLERCYVTDTEL